MNTPLGIDLESDDDAGFHGLTDKDLDEVVEHILQLDPEGRRFAKVFRDTFDQLYDGQRTGRYRWDQLFKTEKTHYGTLIEINIQREFEFADGEVLDYKIVGREVDCKYSFRDGGWMLPPESWNQLILVATASDEGSIWSVGLVRVSPANRRTTYNRDGKTNLNQAGRSAIKWLFRNVEFAPNVLLQLSARAIEAIYSQRPGQARLDEFFRQAEGRRVHRNTIATVAQQQDYMKRVRYNGGSRTNLQSEGFLILGGDYIVHRNIAQDFGGPVPTPGEFVCLRVAEVSSADPRAVLLDGKHWRRAAQNEAVQGAAPRLPSTRSD